ncbi:MAG: hypothetical protein U5Q44_08435 [Dehalococcoidia bacterium]|nr:hypothetical protein [Dehalococcoidia bacterium]
MNSIVGHFAGTPTVGATCRPPAMPLRYRRLPEVVVDAIAEDLVLRRAFCWKPLR